MMKFASVILVIYVLLGCAGQNDPPGKIIAEGQMPAIAIDGQRTLHVAYGRGDSILYTSSRDLGNSFTTPLLVAVLPGAFSFAMRGPQIAAAGSGLIISASTQAGNIYSFYKKGAGEWQPGARINDVDTVAKEGLMALAATPKTAFAVWLDLRGNNRNKIYGAKTVDGGRSWAENRLLYSSPDSTVCECCKPSVVIDKNNVYIMFRNQLNGNRDMYLLQSHDSGESFGGPQKLGEGSWKLDGCPMDGGSLAVDQAGTVRTVWRREAKLYTAIPGMPEQELGEGKGCTMEVINKDVVYAWAEAGNVVIKRAGEAKRIVGKGSQPVLKALDERRLICVWENEKKIHAAVIEI